MLCAFPHLQAWLRVSLGYHTTAQVLAGFLLGSVTALAWLHLGTAYAHALLEKGGLPLTSLYVTTLGSIALFVVNNMRTFLATESSPSSKPGGGGSLPRLLERLSWQR